MTQDSPRWPCERTERRNKCQLPAGPSGDTLCSRALNGSPGGQAQPPPSVVGSFEGWGAAQWACPCPACCRNGPEPASPSGALSLRLETSSGHGKKGTKATDIFRRPQSQSHSGREATDESTPGPLPCHPAARGTDSNVQRRATEDPTPGPGAPPQGAFPGALRGQEQRGTLRAGPGLDMGVLGRCRGRGPGPQLRPHAACKNQNYLLCVSFTQGQIQGHCATEFHPQPVLFSVLRRGSS